MRWTGLRIRDAATLERHRLKLDPVTGLWNVMIYQRKTGDPVYCPIPPHVAELLNTIPASQKGNTNERYFFWTSTSTWMLIAIAICACCAAVVSSVQSEQPAWKRNAKHTCPPRRKFVTGREHLSFTSELLRLVRLRRP